MNDLLEQVKAGEEIDVYLSQHTGHGYYRVSHYPPDGDIEYLPIGKGKVIFSIETDESIAEKATEAFRAQKQKAYAEAEIKVSQIKEAEARFLSITHQPDCES